MAPMRASGKGERLIHPARECGLRPLRQLRRNAKDALGCRTAHGVVVPLVKTRAPLAKNCSFVTFYFSPLSRGYRQALSFSIWPD